MATRPGLGNAGAEVTGGELATIDEAYTVNVIPSELFLKFRKEIEGLRVGVNLKFFNYEVNDYEAKLVLKPLDIERKWRLMYRPIHGNIHILSVSRIVGVEPSLICRKSLKEPLAMANATSGIQDVVATEQQGTRAQQHLL
jgi:hypothetical protein